jgi:hypothetical protein
MARDSYSDQQLISAAMEAGIMLSTGHGQSSTKLMPVSDLSTLRNFARRLQNAAQCSVSARPEADSAPACSTAAAPVTPPEKEPARHTAGRQREADAKFVRGLMSKDNDSATNAAFQYVADLLSKNTLVTDSTTATGGSSNG